MFASSCSPVCRLHLILGIIASVLVFGDTLDYLNTKAKLVEVHYLLVFNLVSILYISVSLR